MTEFLGGDTDWIASRRFPVVQDGGAKVRGVDDLSASLVNATVTSFEKIVPGSADRVASLVAFMARAANESTISIPLTSGEVLQGVRHSDFEQPESRRILGTTIDLAAAYRQLPILPAHQWACVIVAYDPVRKVLAYRILHALPFGATAAVEAFLRASLALKVVGQSRCHLCWECFFDDFPLVEYAPLCGTSRTSALALLRRLGWVVSSEKLQACEESFTALGIVFDCAATPHNLLGLRNKAGRVPEVCRLLAEAIAQENLSTPGLQKLRGKLAFASQQTSRQWASLLLSTLRVVDLPESAEARTGALRVLDWFLQNLGSMPPRLLRLAPARPPWIIYSDGSLEQGCAAIGFVLIDSVQKQIWWSRSAVPDVWMNAWTRTGVTHPICDVELLAVVSAYVTWGAMIQGGRCLGFIDNNSCLDALIKNSSDSDGLRPFLCAFAGLDATYQVMWWFARVASHSNPADGPSRLQEMQASSGWSCQETPVHWPECRA